MPGGSTGSSAAIPQIPQSGITGYIDAIQARGGAVVSSGNSHVPMSVPMVGLYGNVNATDPFSGLLGPHRT